MDLIDSEQGAGRWQPLETWRDALARPVPIGSPFRYFGDLLDVQVVGGFPDDRILLVSHLRPGEIREGESPADALVRLGRVVGVNFEM